MRMFSGVGSKACSIRCSVAVFRKHGCEVAMLIGMQGSCRGQLRGASRRDCRSSEYACGCFLVWGEMCTEARGEEKQKKSSTEVDRGIAQPLRHKRAEAFDRRLVICTGSATSRSTADGAHAQPGMCSKGMCSKGVLD